MRERGLRNRVGGKKEVEERWRGLRERWVEGRREGERI